MVHPFLSTHLFQTMRERARVSSVEVGGLLLGTLDGLQDTIWLREERPFTGKAGPKTLNPTRRDVRPRELNGHDVLGWWHSHPGGNPGLSKKDLTLHRKMFKEPWHVALVVGQDGDLAAYGWEGREVRAVPRVHTFADGDRNG